jgi:hypothetical protein
MKKQWKLPVVFLEKHTFADFPKEEVARLSLLGMCLTFISFSGSLEGVLPMRTFLSFSAAFLAPAIAKTD